MTNLHVIFVHFPIAFFTLYSILEVLRFKKLTSQPYWFYLKAVLVIAGAGASYVTALTGAMRSVVYQNDSYIMPILQKHGFFATVTILIFTVIAFGYLVAWVNRQSPAMNSSKNGFWKFLTKVSNLILKNWVVVILALLGLASVTITGGLGGAMSFGPDSDPFFKPVFEWLMQWK